MCKRVNLILGFCSLCFESSGALASTSLWNPHGDLELIEDHNSYVSCSREFCSIPTYGLE